jgi:glycosyltransferase involved in cell wall biosynthesis
MMSNPIVSVLMTAYNSEKYIGEAIESVLASTLRDFELIVVDDGSADKTVEIVKKYATLDQRVRFYINEKNLGDYPNRNMAASYASGKYIKYLDADDLIYFYGIEVMVNYMERFPGAGFGLASKADDNKPFPVLLQPKEAYLEHFFGFSHFDRAPGSSIILNEAFKKVGGFSGKRMIGDYELWFKLGRLYPMVKLPHETYWNRQHDMQESKSAYAKKKYASLRLETLNEALAHPECPLTSEDIRRVRNQIKKQKQKNFVYSFFANVNRLMR